MRGGAATGIHSVDIRSRERGVMVGRDSNADANGTEASAYPGR